MNESEFSKLVVASHNGGKIKEISDLLLPFGLDVIAAPDLGLIEPAETEKTFVGNAILKARAAVEVSGLPAIADDSGLEVSSLEGKPGIFSARWAGPKKDFYMAMRKINNKLKAADRRAKRKVSRSARFVCALAVVWPSGKAESFEGTVDGDLCWPPRGEKGFGYDPIFLPKTGSQTFGEIEPELKHAISHRAEAFQKLTNSLFG